MKQHGERHSPSFEVWNGFVAKVAQCGFVGAFWAFVATLLEPFWMFRFSPTDFAEAAFGLSAGLLAGLLAFTTAPYRALGYAVIASAITLVGVVPLAAFPFTSEWTVLPPEGIWLVPTGFGIALGGVATTVALTPTAPKQPPFDGRGDRVRQFRRTYSIVFNCVLAVVTVSGFVAVAARVGHFGSFEPAEFAFLPLSILAVGLCALCCSRFFRPFVEVVIEPFFRLLYRVRVRGQGLNQFPPFGPCLVIANHACWFDPLFVAEILPRPVTPIMTQRFYEKWFLKPLLKYVFRVIVVPEKPMKRETPELEQGIAALDRGEVVVIFPEGYLRRKEEVPLRRFGQGVWHILAARPQTPVVACWVEGGWGSKFSYFNGPPTKNKPMDFRRPIAIAVSEPEAVPAEVLADQMATRIHLMNRVAGMRVDLGLTTLPPFEVPTSEDASTAESE